MIADAKTKVYGDADPSLTYQVSGLKNGDTAGAVLNGGSLSRVAGENVGVYGINQGTRLRTERSEVRILLSAPYFEGFLSSGARRAKDRQLRSFTVKQALPAGGRKKHRHALIAQLDRVLGYEPRANDC